MGMKKFLLFAIFLVSLSFLISSVKAQEFLYSFYMIINNTQNSDDLINYQYGINLSYSYGMQPDFSDVRFFWYNSTNKSEVKIPYWVENYTEYGNATFWLLIPYIPANGYSLIHIYYGNTTPVSSESNGELVFNFFDDFETDKGWNYTETKEGWEDGGRVLTDKGYSAYIYHPLTNELSVEYAWKSRFIRGGSFIVEGDAKYYKSYCGGLHISVIVDNNIIWESYTADIWLKFKGNTTIFGDISELKLRIGIGGICGGSWPVISAGVYWDNIRIRNYTDPEPTYSIDQAPEITIFSPLNQSYYGSIDFVFKATDDFDENFTVRTYLNNQLEYENLYYQNNTQTSYSKSLPMGTYNFTVYAEDSFGASSQQEVIFTSLGYCGDNICQADYENNMNCFKDCGGTARQFTVGIGSVVLAFGGLMLLATAFASSPTEGKDYVFKIFIAVIGIILMVYGIIYLINL
jgi:hypothetical protein